MMVVHRSTAFLRRAPRQIHIFSMKPAGCEAKRPRKRPYPSPTSDGAALPGRFYLAPHLSHCAMLFSFARMANGGTKATMQDNTSPRLEKLEADLREVGK